MAKAELQNIAEELKLTMTTQFIPWSQSRSKTEKHLSLNWLVTLKRDGRDILTTDYMAGCAHYPSYKLAQASGTQRQHDAMVWECEHGRKAFVHGGGHISGQGAPLQPDLCDVLYSLACDSDVLDSGTFEEWASNFGYDTDSRKAEQTYRACLEIALKLRNALGEEGLTKLREACQDY